MKTLNDAFTEAYHDHADALYRYAFFKVSRKEAAEDLVQETFTRTWAYLSEGKEITALKAFLFRTLSNLIVNEYRKHKALSLEALEESSGFDPSSDDSDRLLRSIDGEHALKLLERLPDEYREVIFMRYVEDFSLDEIAAVTDESKNVLTVRIHRGVKKLRELFDQNPATPSKKQHA